MFVCSLVFMNYVFDGIDLVVLNMYTLLLAFVAVYCLVFDLIRPEMMMKKSVPWLIDRSFRPEQTALSFPP